MLQNIWLEMNLFHLVNVFIQCFICVFSCVSEAESAVSTAVASNLQSSTYSLREARSDRTVCGFHMEDWRN